MMKTPTRRRPRGMAWRRRNRLARLLRAPGTAFGQRMIPDRRRYSRKVKHRHNPLALGYEYWWSGCSH